MGTAEGIVARAGFGIGLRGGLLGSEQFTYDGTSYSITALETRKTTVSDELRFRPSALFLMAADSKLALELDDGHTRRRFLLSEADRQPTFYRWYDHGLTWADGETVEIKLIELRD